MNMILNGHQIFLKTKQQTPKKKHCHYRSNNLINLYQLPGWAIPGLNGQHRWVQGVRDGSV
jgi:hypothetical protein